MILVFVIFGNPASGWPFARPLLPGLWRTAPALALGGRVVNPVEVEEAAAAGAAV
ncbi:MAG: hypothetical protein ACRDPE_11425 [Solirubrobacterales bacterium]